MSADNGVVEEGVASAPQSVTLSQTIEFYQRPHRVSSIAKHFAIDLLVGRYGSQIAYSPIRCTQILPSKTAVSQKNIEEEHRQRNQ